MAGIFPNAGVVNRAALRPVEGAVPGVVGGPVIEKEKVKPNGTIKVKELALILGCRRPRPTIRRGRPPITSRRPIPPPS